MYRRILPIILNCPPNGYHTKGMGAGADSELCSSLDNGRPICARCSKGNMTCFGYRDALFIDDGCKVQQRLHRESMLKFGRRSEEPRPSPDLIETRVRSQHNFCTSQGSRVWPSLSASPWKDDIVSSYLIANLGPMGIVYRDLNTSNYKPDTFQRSAGKQSFLALATAFYGVGHEQGSIIDDSRDLYSQALKMVNATISDTSHLTVGETLSSVVSLCLYEVSRNLHFGIHPLISLHLGNHANSD
jgi:hypothetical protein